jgi:hypothetical protein
MQAPLRSIGTDIHRQFVMVAAVDEQQHILFDPIKVPLDTFQFWTENQLQTTDQVALEATTNAWTVYQWWDGVRLQPESNALWEIYKKGDSMLKLENLSVYGTLH